uniref:Uncharacterized protein n=1 Tax=Heterorhabditis bacteriophora TaxID=37862 RepID=A0A1I7X7K9_HETBA
MVKKTLLLASHCSSIEMSVARSLNIIVSPTSIEMSTITGTFLPINCIYLVFLNQTKRTEK